MSKHATLLLTTILLLSALLVAKPAPASAQSVPQFTLKLLAYPYDVPTSYGIDPLTGKNVTIEEGYHVANESIEITIKNQRDLSNLFYNVRYKGHFGEIWTMLYDYSKYSTESLHPQSNSGYTVISIPRTYPFIPGAQIDFQVEALLWHYVDVWVSDHPMAPPPIGEIGHYEQRFTLLGTSGWSNTQTMTFPIILPNVTILIAQYRKFNTSNVPLDFAVDQPVTEIKYSLDSQENVTVTGNTTLTGLVNGHHNITVYATDEAGNTGASETLFFNVEAPEPLPVVVATAVFIVAVVTACAGLLFHFKKRKR